MCAWSIRSRPRRQPGPSNWASRSMPWLPSRFVNIWMFSLSRRSRMPILWRPSAELIRRSRLRSVISFLHAHGRGRRPRRELRSRPVPAGVVRVCRSGRVSRTVRPGRLLPASGFVRVMSCIPSLLALLALFLPAWLAQASCRSISVAKTTPSGSGALISNFRRVFDFRDASLKQGEPCIRAPDFALVVSAAYVTSALLVWACIARSLSP